MTIALGALPNSEAKPGELRALWPHYDHERAAATVTLTARKHEGLWR
jgi:hypothetical protein